VTGTCTGAVMAVYELEHVTLENALELTILAAEHGDKRWAEEGLSWRRLGVYQR
jgi:hypothetical protein